MPVLAAALFGAAVFVATLIGLASPPRAPPRPAGPALPQRARPRRALRNA